MTVQEFMRSTHSRIALKSFVVLLCLVMVCFTLRNMGWLENKTISIFKPEDNTGERHGKLTHEGYSLITLKTLTSAPHNATPTTPPNILPTTPPTTLPTTSPKPQSFCTFKALSPEDANEERLILDSIAWPETPPLTYPLSLNETSDPAHSTFTILPNKGGGEWHVGDQLEVLIQVFDFQGNAKTFGGDVLLVRLHNRTFEAGVAGQVVDHLNGSYSAVFPLLWEGGAQVEVILVHSSEAVTILRRVSAEQPDRVSFKGVFKSGSKSETTSCNACLRPTNKQLCNFTDARTGDPWFCFKPKKLSCDARVGHSFGRFKKQLKPKEEDFFQRGVNLKVSVNSSGPAFVTVLPKTKGKPTTAQSSGKSSVSGYYYQGLWRSLTGTKVLHFSNSSDMSQCLKDKMLYLYGDSTIRQWFEYLDASLPDAKTVKVNNVKKAGPFMIWDSTKSTLITYRCHGPPLRFFAPTSELRYIANELDGLVGGGNTVVVIGIWSHLSTFPIQFYIRRLQSIRRAVVRLLSRAPETLVVIRTANLKYLAIYETLTNSDWYSLQRDKVLRAVFKGLNVKLVDAWEMTLAHHLPHNLHPQPPIIKNMIDVLLSYVCPQQRQ